MSEKFYTEEIAKDPKTSPEILKKILERGKDDYVSCYAASNFKCPPDALKMVLERGNDDTVSGASVLNPNCPPEALMMIIFLNMLLLTPIALQKR